MSKIRVAINGFGRIGRLVARNIILNYSDEYELVAVNDLTDTRTLAHLFKYDSTQGQFPGTVTYTEGGIVVNGKTIVISAEREPANLKWTDHNVDVLVESTGRFTNAEKAKVHLEAGAKKVIISAPATGDVQTIVLGVNDELIKSETQIYSNASCTTNCLAPMVKVLDDNFGIEKGFMTTVHAYTNDQNTLDAPHKDLRRARAAAANIIPTTTGAAKAVTLVVPHLAGRLDGSAIRVPVPTGSITDFVAVLNKEASEKEIVEAFRKAAETNLKGILEFSDEDLVSTDIVGNPSSCIFDSKLTKVDGKLVKIVGWYDNEAGYSARTADLIGRVFRA